MTETHISEQAGAAKMAPSRFIRNFSIALVIGGIIVRLSPLLDIDARLFWQFVTEDGYYMQTIARNMARGLGMTISDGTIPTNGVQPLATFLFAALHFFAGGSKAIGILLVTLASTAISLGGLYYFHRLACLVLKDIPSGKSIGLLASVAWFISPRIIGHSMNGLETGLYHLASLMTLYYYFHEYLRSNGHFEWRSRVILGLLFGITFLARIDAVFLIAGILIVHLFLPAGGQSQNSKSRFLDCLTSGSLSVFIASPWLIYNYMLFGSIVPISGIAQSQNLTFAQNFAVIPANLFEYLTVLVPVPREFESHTAVMWLSTIILVAAAIYFWRSFAKHYAGPKRFMAVMLLCGAGLVTYYGFFFGAVYFISRYLSLLSPALALLGVATVYHLYAQTGRMSQSAKEGVLWGATLLVGAGLNGVSYLRPPEHMHKQVVQWVEKNVDPETWVGAIQTGTLGYFHDRTINLDGKVNPDALRAKIEAGHVLNYVLDTDIEYLVDWYGISTWGKSESEVFNRTFYVIVAEEDNNLAVLKRTLSPELSSSEK